MFRRFPTSVSADSRPTGVLAERAWTVAVFCLALLVLGGPRQSAAQSPDGATTSGTAAAVPPEDEVELISRMSGCFEVTYRFVEDGEHDALSPEYGLEDPVVEWIGFERRDGGRLVLTHAALRQGRAVAHFHEEWRYGGGDGEWRHEVWDRTADDPERQLRYACESAWRMNRWECAAGRAGKPFRDSGAPFGFDRDDYDWLDRTNTLLVTPRGWVHAERNRKMTEGGEVVAHELGWITYERIEEDACGEAPRRFPN